MNRDDQVRRNLDLVERFVLNQIAHPELIEPGSHTVVLIPADDLELAEANIATARKLAGGAKATKRRRGRARRPAVSLALA